MLLLLLGGSSKGGSVRTRRGEVFGLPLIRFANPLRCPAGPDNERACWGDPVAVPDTNT